MSGFVRAGGLRVVDDGLDFEARLPWMRSLPWRCINQISVTLDGQELPGSCLRLHVDGRLVRIEECSSLDRYWMIGRAVTVQVRRRRMQEGALLCVSVRFVIPYVEGDDGPPELLAATTLRLPVAQAGDHIDMEVG